MALTDYSDLNDMHLDVLREIGNIGSGNAASSLSQMIGQAVYIDVPDVRILDSSQVIELMGGPETMIAGLMVCLTGNIEGMMMFLIDQRFAGVLLQALMGIENTDFNDIDDMSKSAIQEMSNIMTASFVNAIADMTGLTIDKTAPAICIDMLGAIMNVPATFFANMSDKILFIQNEFGSEEPKAPAHIIMMPDIESLTRLMGSLGIE
jgi:chemotaxis protein CheC